MTHLLRKNTKRTLILFSVCFTVIVSLFAFAKIEFTYPNKDVAVGDPYMGGLSTYSLLKKIDLSTSTVTWPDGRMLEVGVGSPVNGLGVGEGTLAPVTILGKTYTSSQDGTQSLGTKSKDGSWDDGSGQINTFISREIDENSKQTRFYWAVEGDITLTPYVWQESVSIGGAIRIPLQVQGTYSTSGTWKVGSSTLSTTRSAPSGNTGHHIVKHEYYCSQCEQSGNSAAAIGGASAHAWVYEKCPSLHAHWACDGSDHSLQASCLKTDGNGNTCTVINFYACEKPPHTCEFGSGSGSGSGSGIGSMSALAACGIHDASASGDHTLTYLCNILPCSNRIVPYCFDQCPEAGNHGKVVCAIQGCQDSTPYDATSSSAGWHAPCNECSQYKCKGGDHSWDPSCSDTTHTNANGDSCTVAGYECVSHTPVYPAAPAPVFSPSFSGGVSTYAPGDTFSGTVSTGTPVYGVMLYVWVPSGGYTSY